MAGSWWHRRGKYCSQTPQKNHSVHRLHIFRTAMRKWNTASRLTCCYILQPPIWHFNYGDKNPSKWIIEFSKTWKMAMGVISSHPERIRLSGVGWCMTEESWQDTVLCRGRPCPLVFTFTSCFSYEENFIWGTKKYYKILCVRPFFLTNLM